MRKEATRRDARLDVPVLLAETGFLDAARAAARRLLDEAPRDPERLGLVAQLAHRAGAVSEALDGFRALHEGSPHSHGALLRLATLYREEERPRPPPIDLPLVRRALRLLASGASRRAMAACEQGAAAARRAGDREQLKLLEILRALMLEIDGDLHGAAAALEAMGRDRAFTLDLDRLALLARVSERSGDHTRLSSAERVLAYLTADGKLSAFPRLILVRAALGDRAGEARARAAYVDAFRRRMHALDPAERLDAARLCFVPPERLGQVHEPADAQGRAIVALSRGDAEAALPLLAGDPSGWRAAALLALGRGEEAAREAARALAEDPLSVPLSMLVGRAAAAGGDPGRAALERAARLLGSAAAADPAAMRAHAACLSALGEGERAEQLEARARAAEEAPWPPPGVVRAAAVYLLPGKPKGLVHDVIARRRPARRGEAGQLVERDVLGALAGDTRAAIRRTFAAVKELLALRYPERARSLDAFAYGLHVTKEDEPSAGVSLGLPVAVAFASVLLQRPLPRTLAFTGAISYDAAGRIAVRPVGEVGVKLKGALGAGVERLVVPEAQREEVLSGAVVPVEIAREAAVPVGSFDEVLALIGP